MPRPSESLWITAASKYHETFLDIDFSCFKTTTFIISVFRNKSVESLQLNAQRLKEYKSKLILFPLSAKKPRKGDSSAEEMSKAVQLAGEVMPVKPVVKRSRAMAVTEDLTKFQAFQTIRQARAFKRLHGIRAKKAADAEADNIDKKK